MCHCLETLQRLTSSRGGRLSVVLCIMWTRYMLTAWSCAQTNKQTNKQKHQHIFLTMHKTTASCILNANLFLAMLSPIVVNSFLDLCPPFFFGGTKNAILLSMQPAVSAALLGRVLVVEGVEKAERNVLPVLNNLLENREMQLEDGRFILSADRYDKLLKVCDTQHNTVDTRRTSL